MEDYGEYHEKPSKHAPRARRDDDYDDYQEKPAKHTTGAGGHQPASSSELLSEAKYLAEAAQHALRGESGSIDKSRLAGAAEDVLEAASRYGKLDEKGFGQYIDKAETYLHKYGGHSSSGGAHSYRPEQGGGGGRYKEEYESGGGGGRYKEEEYGSGGRYNEEEEERPESESGGHRRHHKVEKEEETGSGGGGYGDYLKMAEGFMKKF